MKSNNLKCQKFKCYDGCITEPFFCPTSENFDKCPCFKKILTCEQCTKKDFCWDYEKDRIIWEA